MIITKEDFTVVSHFDCNTTMKVGSTIYGSGVFEIMAWSMPLHLFTYSDKVTKQTYFVIESPTKVEYGKFASILDEIILAITYLTGVFLGKEI